MNEWFKKGDFHKIMIDEEFLQSLINNTMVCLNTFDDDLIVKVSLDGCLRERLKNFKKE